MTTPPPIESFEVPAVPQRFEALERIGPGGGGTVFKARDTRLRRVVALKFLDEADGTQDALAEARALATLSHPHVVSVYEVDTESHPPFIVMEFVAGVTLRSMIETSPLPMEQALRLAVQIASGLVAAHQAGLLHRDLSASNILVSEGERAKVVDFGLATGRRPQGAEAAIEPFPTAGTLGYMAPEQLTGRPLDHRTDIFSLGVILYEMITGRRPFGGATAAETARAALTEEPPPLGRSCPGIPLRLEAIVRRALEKDQGQRYATAQDMLLDLQALGAAGKPAGEFSIPPTVAPDANPGLGPPLPEWTGRWFSPRALLGRSRFRRRRTPVATQGAAIAFRGLLPFQEADRNRFFGREHETAALFDKVIHRDYRLGILFGESGCGKTSLLQAGLIPRLWEAGYVPIYCRAARRPDEAIIAECRRRSGVEPQPGDLTVDYLARSAQAGAGLVLILDQFEEFFASSPTVAEREPFLSLVAALEATPAPIKVLVAIRSDFLYLIGSELEQRVPDPLRTSRLFRLHDLDEERAASIIEATARRAALSWDGDLVRRVACDLAGGGAVRPSELQIVCERMQARRVHSIGEYVGAGGKEALVSEFLQDVVDGTGRRDDAARLLHCLVSDEGSRLALTAADIAGRTHSQPTAVARLLRVLVDARIVRETQDEEPWRYELIHDYLVERVQRMAGKRLDATERANRLFRQYLARHALDPRTRIPLREAWWVRRHSDLCRGVREEALLRKSLRAGSFRLASLVVLLLGASIGLAALLSVREEWDSVRFADGHTSAVRRVVFSPDGKLLASSGEDRRVIVWDFSRREPAAMLEGHGDQVTAIAFSPDGRWLASGSDDRSVVIWDTARLEKTRVLLGHRGRVRAVGFSPDGRFLVTSSEMPPAIVWRTDGWERLHDLPTRTGEQGTVAFFADGSVDPGIEARAWDLVTGKERAMRLDVKWTSQARSVSPDGSLLAWMDPDGVLAMANLGTARLLWSDRAHRDHARAVQFSPDGRLVATAAEDVVLWDVATRKRVARFEHPAIVWSLAFSPDGRWLVSAHGDGAILVWDVARQERVANLAEHSAPVRAVAVSPDGSRVASASEDRSVILWDPTTLRKKGVLVGHSTRVMAAAFHPTGDLATCDQDGHLFLWDSLGGTPRWSVRIGYVCYAVAVSPDGRWVASSLGIHDSTTGLKVVAFDPTVLPRAYSLAFSPDGRRLAVGAPDRTALLVFSGEPWHLESEDGTVGPISISFSPDGRRLASGDDFGAVRLWALHPLRPEALIGRHQARVKSVAFSPDGREVASAGDDRAIRLWNVARRRQVGQIDSHSAPVLSIAFSPDGRQLVSGEHDRSVRLHARHRALWGHRLD